jgi:hypothetical protein
MTPALSSMLFVARTTTLPSVPVMPLARTQLLGPIRSLIPVTGLRHRALIIKTLRPFPHDTATDESLQRP